MAKHTFFQYGYSGFFNGSVELLPHPFNSLDYNAIKTHASYKDTCLLFRANPNATMTLIPGIVRSISRVYYSVKYGYTGFGGWTRDNDDFYFDYYDGSKEELEEDVNSGGSFGSRRHIVMKLDASKHMSATIVDEYGGQKPYVITTHAKQKDSHSASAAIACLLAYIYEHAKTAEESTIKAHLDDLLDNDSDMVKMANATICLANDMYAYINYAYKFNDQTLDVSDYDNPIINQLTNFRVLAENQVGNSKFFNSGTIKQAINPKQPTKTVKDYLNGDYILNPNRVLSPEEEIMVPKMDDMVPDEEILSKAKLIKGSTLLPRPFRNIKWVGETGTGKTTAAQILAQLLNLPYCFMTFNPDTMVNDLYLNILPSNKPKVEIDMDKMSGILETAVFNPEEAWKELTGEEKKGVSTKDVLTKVLEDSVEQTSEFMHVESPLVQAFRYGWLCELQESNVASKPGVLVALNAALDDIGIIQLPTGERIKRHKDTIVVMTENVGYEGTRRSNQAVDSRMTLKGQFELPDDNMLAKRISQNSGLKDIGAIKKMIDVMYAIQRIRDENGETGGACGVRELQSWAQATDILSDAHEAAKATIIPSASNDKELYPAILAAVEVQFPPKK